MATEQFANSAQTTLVAAIVAADTSISVVTAAPPFPASAPFRIQIGDELLMVTAVAGTAWTVDRHLENTTAVAHSAGALVTQVLTAGAMSDLFPDQAGNAGKFLTTDGGETSWATVPPAGVTSVGLTVPSFLSVSGSPVTTSGTLAVTLATETANAFFAGPSSGGAATPTFRSLATADIPDSAVTYAKVQNVSATDKVLGRSSSGAGNVEEIACTAFARTILDDPDAATVRSTIGVGTGTGTVTSVALTVPSFLSVSGSPVTSSGTLAVTLATETVNTIFAGPSSGGAAAPAFRSLVTADIPDSGVTYGKIQNVSATDKVLGRASSGAGNVEEIACTAFARTILDDADAATVRTTIGAGTGNGTVTSVALTVPAFLSVSGSPVTSSGTLAVGLATQAANTVLAGPTSGPGATPTFRALVAADVPASVPLGLVIAVSAGAALP